MLFISFTVRSEVDCLSNFTFNERVALHETLKNNDEIAQSYLKCMNKQLNVKIKVEIIIWCILYIKNTDYEKKHFKQNKGNGKNTVRQNNP